VLEVGKVIKPHGLKGQVVVELWTNRTERMVPGGRFDTDGRVLEIVATRHLSDARGDRWLVTFDGLSSREDADRLRGAVLCAEPIEVEGALWVHEMIGSEVVDLEGATVGRVEAVQANPASDLLVLEDGRLIPLVFVTVSAPGRLIVDPPAGLLDP
jgi:16S rRNA processing protein RimM